jgi:hypothetical protein
MTVADRRDAGVFQATCSTDGRIRGQATMSRRLGLWITVLALPLAALGLLLAEPHLDGRWEHHPSHFWLVLTIAAVNVALGLVASEAAARRDDDRTFLVSMALLASAGFLGLHALSTPGILVDHMTAGFSVAALAQVPLLDRPLPPDAVPPPLGFLALVGVALYGIAAVRYAELYRRRHRPLPLAVLVAFVLLAEAMIAVAFSRTWHAMWWEWHVLMAVAFGAILLAARVEYRREGSLTAVFGGIYLDSTLRRIDRHDRAVRRGCHHRRLQRGNRPTRSRRAGGPRGAGHPRGNRSAGRRAFQLATVPHRRELRAGGRRQRRRRPPAQLHCDRGHHQPGGAATGHGAPRRGRHRPHDTRGSGRAATVVPLGTAQVRGRREPVPIYRLVAVAG